MTIKNYEQTLVGRKFGRLTIMSASGFKGRFRVALCRCDCGNIGKYEVQKLKSGNTGSCGCLKKEHNRAYFTTHGCTKTPLHRVWLSIRDRCLNKNCKVYPSYGGRGVTICNEWENFEAFQAWAISQSYRKGLTVERVDNNAGYSPENCILATRATQNNNKRNNVVIEYRGEKLNLAQWAKKLGVNRETIKWRVKAGWSTERIFTTPMNHQSKIEGQKAA